ncbi:glutathione hydrolase 6-like [Narcine bancroftii]|uniref:glutathione hydrolase 6-like n=1 Tax=Narcine bancroftii TaxID=1343680 RepID=UPI003831A485
MSSAARYHRLRAKDWNEEEVEEAEDVLEGDNVSIDLHSPAAHTMLSHQKQKSCIYVTASMVLLGIGLYFGFSTLWVASLDTPGAGGAMAHHTDGHPQHTGDHHHEHGIYHHAAAITDSEICSRFAKEILIEGGNAVDAGVVAMLCLGVVHPHSTGIGGVVTAVFHNRTSGKTKALNALPKVPLNLTLGTPLLLQGLWAMHQEYGRLAWARLLGRPAKLAREGFVVDQILAGAAREAADHGADLCPLLCERGRGTKGVGAHTSNEKLAEVLELAREMEGTAFPEPLAQRLSRDLRWDPQALNTALERQRVALIEPLVTDLQGFSLAVPPPPASGDLLIQLMTRISQLGLSWTNVSTATYTSNMYRNILSIAQQMYLGLMWLDPRTPQNPGEGKGWRRMAPGGSHVAVIDSTGNILAMVSSLNSTFGAQTLSPSSGLFLSDFTGSSDSSALYWACPGVLRSAAGDDVLAVVTSGGSAAPFVSAQVIANLVYFERSAKEAVADPRLYLSEGEEGVLHQQVSGLLKDSEIFTRLSQEVPGLELISRTASSVTSTVVESFLGHKRAFGQPQTCTFGDGY